MGKEQNDRGTEGAHAASDSADASAHEARYDRFTERARVLFGTGQEKSRKAMGKGHGCSGPAVLGSQRVSAEQAEAFRRYMRCDLAQTERTAGTRDDTENDAKSRANAHLALK
ncbi:MAG: hypothetical protein M3Z16_05850 [Pseudomonadota bacterium]|nr:hypothetical protein [Pseudomonadota bacterium]